MSKYLKEASGNAFPPEFLLGQSLAEIALQTKIVFTENFEEKKKRKKLIYSVFNICQS